MKTFRDFDLLQLEDFGDSLLSFIDTDRHFVDGALILSMSGKFGSGKSTFFEMLENKLISTDEATFDIIKLNAWEADFQSDPLLAIVHEFVLHLESRGISSNIESLKSTAGKLGRMALSVGNDLTTKFTGVDWKKAGKEAEQRHSDMMGKACFDLYKDRNDSLKSLKVKLKKLIEGRSKPIIVLVDELDRCRPDYAVSYLETIKHIFDVEGLVFILGIDREALASSVKSLYGASLDFDEYFRKFAHRNISLPEPQGQIAKSFVKRIYDDYLIKPGESGRFNYGKDHNYKATQLGEFLEAFPLTLRQLHEVMRIMAHALSCSEDKAGRMLWGWNVGAFVMSVLSVADFNLYKSIGTGQITINGFTKKFEEKMEFLKKGSDGLWWFCLLSGGTFESSVLTDEVFEELVRTFGLHEEDWGENYLSSRRRDFNGAYGDWWDGEPSPYTQIYKTIEACKKFAN